MKKIVLVLAVLLLTSTSSWGTNDCKEGVTTLGLFTSSVSLLSCANAPAGVTRIRLHSIEWNMPTAIGHTVVVTDDDGSVIFRQKATAADQSLVKPFYGIFVKNLNVSSTYAAGTSGIGSGSLVILWSYY